MLDVGAKGYSIQIGDQRFPMVAPGETIEVRTDGTWQAGVALRLDVVRVFTPDKDPVTGSIADAWTDGELVLTGSNWDVPVKLTLGAVGAWTGPGSWAQLARSPVSERIALLEQRREQALSTADSFRRWRTRHFDYESRANDSVDCGFSDLPWDTWSDLGLAWLHLSTCYRTSIIPSFIKIQTEIDSLASEELIALADEYRSALEELADVYADAGRYVSGEDDFKRSMYRFEATRSVVTQSGNELQVSIMRFWRETRDLVQEFKRELEVTPNG